MTPRDPLAAPLALLVSVRSVADARAALEGGAALLDVKEPAAGSLGRARDGTIAAIVRSVAGRRPVSAALGEFLQDPNPYSGTGLSFVKWGLAGCGGRPDWRRELAAAWRHLRRPGGPQPVAVAYADWQRAGAPPPEAVYAFAVEHGAGAFLVDTWQKDGRTLLDYLSPGAVWQLVGLCRAGGVRVALAGSLGLTEIRQLRDVMPDWFAVRGAACRGGRSGVIDAAAVRRLVEAIAHPVTAATPAG